MKYKLLVAGLLFFAACGRKDGYKETNNGLLYKYLHQSNDSKEVKVGDYLVMNLAYYSPTDSLLFSSRELSGDYRMRLATPSHPGGNSIEDALTLLHRGDSMSFKIAAEKFFTLTRKAEMPAYLKKGDLLRFEIRLLDIQDEANLQRERESLNQRLLQQEQGLIADYVTKNMPDALLSQTGLYTKILKKGSGHAPLNGQTLTIHFESYFINGEIFESTYKRKKPFSFVYGAQQAIPGLEEALSKMEPGSKVQVLIPSSQAYGAEGFGEKIPPFSPLVFFVELISINSNPQKHI